jgi:hypothetical protein
MVLRLPVFFREIAINFPIAPNGRQGLVVGRLFHFCRYTHDNGIWRYDLSLHHDGPGGNEAIFSDFGAVQNGGMHADDAIFSDRRAVNDGAVSYRDIFFNDRREPEVHVNNGIILNVTVFSDRDRFHIAAYDRTEPNAAILRNGRVADNGRIVRDENGIVNFGPAALTEAKRIGNVFQRILENFLIRYGSDDENLKMRFQVVDFLIKSQRK